MTHFELILYKVWDTNWDLFPHLWMASYSRIICWITFLCWVVKKKSMDPICLDLYLDSLLFHSSMCMSFCQCHTILITIFLSRSLVSIWGKLTSWQNWVFQSMNTVYLSIYLGRLWFRSLVSYSFQHTDPAHIFV